MKTWDVVFAGRLLGLLKSRPNLLPAEMQKVYLSAFPKPRRKENGGVG
jgi:hypothetical protein